MDRDIIRDIYEHQYQSIMSIEDYELIVSEGFRILDAYNNDKLEIRLRCTLEELQAVNKALEYNIARMNRLIA